MDTSNRNVHGLWIGAKLSKLELLTIHSFVDKGHIFNLWTYSGIQNPLPAGVNVRDAADILPVDCVFRRSTADHEVGVGSGSFAGFSDLFRYKLLYEYGGYWVDMDVTCLKPLDFSEPYVFRRHRLGAVGNVIKCPRGSKLMELTYNRASRDVSENCDWHFGNRALSETVRDLGLSRFIRDDLGLPDSWSTGVRSFVEQDVPIPGHLFIIHWLHECWKTLRASGGLYKGTRVADNLPDKNRAHPSTALGKLYQKYGL